MAEDIVGNPWFFEDKNIQNQLTDVLNVLRDCFMKQ